MGEYLKLLSAISEQSEELKPAIRRLVESFAPEIYDVLDRMGAGAVDLKVNMIKRFTEKGFTKDEAILLTIDSFHALEKMSNKNKK